MSRLRASKWLRLIAVVAFVVGVAVAICAAHVHDQTWEWRLTYSATPPLLTYADRHYRRSDEHSPPPGGVTLLGHAAGGAALYSKLLRPYAPTVIWAKTGLGYTVYELMGGP